MARPPSASSTPSDSPPTLTNPGRQPANGNETARQPTHGHQSCRDVANRQHGFRVAASFTHRGIRSDRDFVPWQVADAPRRALADTTPHISLVAVQESHFALQLGHSFLQPLAFVHALTSHAHTSSLVHS
jgi:hypothetical protein